MCTRFSWAFSGTTRGTHRTQHTAPPEGPPHAEEVFGAQGGQGSTEEVARRAKVGIATVFRHFPTKEALVEAALLRHFAGLRERAAELAERGDPGEAFRELGAAMIDTGASKVTLAGSSSAPGSPRPCGRPWAT